MSKSRHTEDMSKWWREVAIKICFCDLCFVNAHFWFFCFGELTVTGEEGWGWSAPLVLTIIKCENFVPLEGLKTVFVDQKTPVFFAHTKKIQERLTVWGGVNPYGQPDHKISFFLLTTSISWKPILAGLLGLTMQSAMQSWSKWLHGPTLYSQLPSSSTVAKATLYLLSKEYSFPLKNILADCHCEHTPASTRGRKIYICTPKKPAGKGQPRCTY